MHLHRVSTNTPEVDYSTLIKYQPVAFADHSFFSASRSM